MLKNVRKQSNVFIFFFILTPQTLLKKRNDNLLAFGIVLSSASCLPQPKIQ